MKKYYAVPDVESEVGWGTKNDGFYIYDDIEVMKADVEKRIENGHSPGYYIGPDKPKSYQTFILKDTVKEKEFENLQKGKPAVAFYDSFREFADIVGERIYF